MKLTAEINKENIFGIVLFLLLLSSIVNAYAMVFVGIVMTVVGIVTYQKSKRIIRNNSSNKY